jgi:hypothetical protein
VPTVKTIGICVVAVFAARAAGTVSSVMMTATRRLTRCTTDLPEAS